MIRICQGTAANRQFLSWANLPSLESLEETRAIASVPLPTPIWQDNNGY